jgi:hypothetical protein
MTLLTETISHNPWTKGEIIMTENILRVNRAGLAIGFIPSGHFHPNLYRLVLVSVGSDRFPNFKEEINV